MRDMLNVMRAQAAQAMGERAATRLGTVKSYDPGNYAVRVAIQPEGNLTGWIPVLSPWVGNGWGMFAPPTAGDLVEVQFQEADHDAPLCCLRLFNDAARPLAVPSGEFWLVHKSGSLVKLTNDGKLLINGQIEIDITAPTLNIAVTGNANLSVGGSITSSAAAWNHTGPLAVAGAVAVTGAITGSSTITAPNLVGTSNVTFGGKSGTGHTHGGVQTGSGATGAPS